MIALSWSWWFVVIAASVITGFAAGAVAVWPRRMPERPPLAPAPPHALLAGPRPAGRFPVDTGPLLLQSDEAAHLARLDREIENAWQAGFAAIPDRWRKYGG